MLIPSVFGKSETANQTPNGDEHNGDELLQDALSTVKAQRSWEKGPNNLAGLGNHIKDLQRDFTPPLPDTVQIAAALTEKLRDGAEGEPALLSEIRNDLMTGGVSYEDIVNKFVASPRVSFLFNQLCAERMFNSKQQLLLNPEVKPLVRLSSVRQNLGVDDQHFFVSKNCRYASRLHAKHVEGPANAVFVSRAYIGLRLTDLAIYENGSAALRTHIKNGSLLYALPELPKALTDEKWYERWNLLQDCLNLIEDDVQHPVEKRIRLAKNDFSLLEIRPRGTHHGTALFPVIAFSPDPDGKKEYDLACQTDIHELLDSAIDSKKFFDLVRPGQPTEDVSDEILEIKAYFQAHA